MPRLDLFGVHGRQLLARLALPEPWQGTIDASLRLIDELDREIGECERELRRLGAEHRYVPLVRAENAIRVIAELGVGWCSGAPPRAHLVTLPSHGWRRKVA